MQKIIIVGAGIIGAALASRLARLGAGVTVLDRARAGEGLATARSLAWLNASWGNAEPYFRLRVASLDEWRRMAVDVPGIAPNWCGSLLWDLPEAEMKASMPTQTDWGYNVDLVDGVRAMALEPALQVAPEMALYAPDEGAIEPVEAAQALLNDATSHGARVQSDADVARLVSAGEKVTGVLLADGTCMTADHVVLACGTGTNALTEPFGCHLPLEAPPGLLALTTPQERLLNGLVVSPRAHVRQRPDGRLIAGTDFAGADPGNDPEGVAADIIATVAGLINAKTKIALESFTVGYRPTPKDGVSIAGRLGEGLTVAVTHSGITLAPILAKLLAAEILTGARDPLLAPFGPDRFENTA